jgi:hypothetical protein
MLGFRRVKEAEVLGIVAQEYAEPTKAVVPHSAPGYHALQRDRLTLTLLYRQQAGAERVRLISWQVAHHQAVDPDRNGVGVVGVSILGQQHCIDIGADPFLWSVPPADHAPEIFLAIRLAHYFKVMVTFQKRSLQHALVHPCRAILLIHRPEPRGSCRRIWPGIWVNI